MEPSHFLAWAFLPALTLALLTLVEVLRPRPGRAFSGEDWILNGSGLLIQGTVIPLASLAVGKLLALCFTGLDGVLEGSAAAFAMSFVVLDFLYYWQHRWLHGAGWVLHRTHHGASRLGAWVCARNSLLAHPLFVYFVPSAMLSLLCQDKLAFFAGAMLTASLDLWRHCAIRWPACLSPANRILSLLLVTPVVHHWHHKDGAPRCNFGANLAVWDRLFATYVAPDDYPRTYGIEIGQGAIEQLLAPANTRRTRHASRT
jgi:sterol desaturase/sphingolipid hydroxylase (fatty acid hydroxylase superfamily)